MPLWKIAGGKPERINETALQHEKLLEEHLEDWIVADPSILGEPLLIIGRQVLIPDTRDRLDLLALDPQGNAVIIELKRGQLKDPVDIQALRYASYIAKWRFDDFENQAKNFWNKTTDPEFNFNSELEDFCDEAGVDESPTLNQDQRLVIVGSAVREKLGSVALWLRDHSVDLTVIEVQAFKDGDSMMIQPSVIVPVQVSRFAETGRMRPEGAPWITDGRGWHLDKRCSPKTKEMMLTLDQLLQERLAEIDGPHWNQKHYVAYRVGNYNWLVVVTTPNTLKMQFLVKAGVFSAETVASELGIVTFERDDPLAEKLGLASSVVVLRRNENNDRVTMRIKEPEILASQAFAMFLQRARDAYPRQIFANQSPL